MNQILYTIENEQEKNKMKSIVLFFGIVIIIFGILLVATGGYSIATASAKRKEAMEAAKVPNIELSAENNIITIDVKHFREIKMIEYCWNDDEPIIIDEEGQENLQETIDVLAGKNTLSVAVTDIAGKVSNITQEFTYEGTCMDVSVVDNKNLKIVVTDVKGLKSVTYKWGDDGEEVKAYPDEDDLTTIEVIVDIPIGLNKLIVKSINNENQIETKEREIQGITKPTMSVSYDVEKTTISIKIKDNQGIESYSYKISNAPLEDIIENGKLIENPQEKLTQIVSETKQGDSQKEIIEKVDFAEGFNYIEITITNVEGATETITGWCAK